MNALTSRKRRRRALRPLTTGLWALLLLASQALAVTHLHPDGAADGSCAVCPLVKAQTAAGNPPPALPAVHRAYQHPVTPEARSIRPIYHGPFLARGPPRA